MRASTSIYGPSVSITVTGLDTAIQALRRIDSAMVSELKSGLREDARPILADAKSYARGLGGSGDYAASLSLRNAASGVRIQSTDSGAGVIEFAHRGAVISSGTRRGRRAGVPAASSPPRALVRAVLEDEDEVVSAVETRLEAVIERYL